jgi:hypothetical protein
MKTEKVFEWGLAIYLVVVAIIALFLMGCAAPKSRCVSWAVAVQRDGTRITYCEASVRRQKQYPWWIGRPRHHHHLRWR